MIANRLLSSTLNVAKRRITTTAQRFSADNHGIPGSNLPFQYKNKNRLTLIFIVYFGSAIAVPFVCVRHQMLKL